MGQAAMQKVFTRRRKRGLSGSLVPALFSSWRLVCEVQWSQHLLKSEEFSRSQEDRTVGSLPFAPFRPGGSRPRLEMRLHQTLSALLTDSMTTCKRAGVGLVRVERRIQFHLEVKGFCSVIWQYPPFQIDPNFSCASIACYVSLVTESSPHVVLFFHQIAIRTCNFHFSIPGTEQCAWKGADIH